MEKIAPYYKAVVALLVGVLQVASVYFMVTADGSFDANDKIAVINASILTLGGGAAVYAVKNKK